MIGTTLQGFGTKLECWLGTALFDGPNWKRWYFVPKEWRINSNNNNTGTVNVGCPISGASVEQQLEQQFPSSAVWPCLSMSMYGMNTLGASSGSANCERDWIEDRQTILAAPLNGTQHFIGNRQKQQRFQPYLLDAQSHIGGQLPQRVRNYLIMIMNKLPISKLKKAYIQNNNTNLLTRIESSTFNDGKRICFNFNGHRSPNIQLAIF